MIETREQAKLRLQGEGRWKEALTFREAMKKQGVSPGEAHRRMLERFSPLTANDQAKDSPTPAAGVEAVVPLPPPESPPAKKRRRRRRGQAFDWKREAEWVFLNMDGTDDDGDPPSNGSRAMLKWARANPAEFFRSLARLLPSRAERKQEEKKKQQEENQGGDEALRVIEEQMMRLREESEREWRATVRNWVLDECLKRLQEAAAGTDPDDYAVFAKKEGSPPPPPVPAEPTTTISSTRPPQPPPKRLQTCPYCERERQAGRKPDPRCAACAYIRHYQIEAQPGQN